MPTSYSIHDKGLSTTISQIDRDAFRKKTTHCPLGCRCGVLGNGKYAVEYTHPSTEILSQAMAELERLSSKVSIPPPLREKAAIIYRKALDKGLIRGRSINAIVAASFTQLAAKRSIQNSSAKSPKQASSMRKMLQDATDSC